MKNRKPTQKSNRPFDKKNSGKPKKGFSGKREKEKPSDRKTQKPFERKGSSAYKAKRSDAREKPTREDQFETQTKFGNRKTGSGNSRFKKDTIRKAINRVESKKKQDQSKESVIDKKRSVETRKEGYKKSYEKRRRFEEKTQEAKGEEMRLNRFISNAGIASRRHADELIVAGLVSVNGKVATELGMKVKPGDEVRFNGERISGERKAYIIMNKPKDTITTMDDPDQRRIVTDLLLGHDLPRVYPVGRLDRNTTGVLILTNDGELSTRLMHPKYGIQKVYKATLNKNIKGEDIRALANGVDLEDGFIKPDAVMLADPKDKKEVVVELHSGKNHIVHRMFEHLGYSLDKLDRVVYGGFNKKGMKRGEWRELNDREVKQIKKMVQL